MIFEVTIGFCATVIGGVCWKKEDTKLKIEQAKIAAKLKTDLAAIDKSRDLHLQALNCVTFVLSFAILAYVVTHAGFLKTVEKSIATVVEGVVTLFVAYTALFVAYVYLRTSVNAAAENKKAERKNIG